MRKKHLKINIPDISLVSFFLIAGQITAALSGRAARHKMVTDAGFYYIL